MINIMNRSNEDVMNEENILKAKEMEKAEVGLNGRGMIGISNKTGKPYTAFEIYWKKPTGQTLQIKQVFLSDLELEMLDILQSSLTK